MARWMQQKLLKIKRQKQQFKLKNPAKVDTTLMSILSKQAQERVKSIGEELPPTVASKITTELPDGRIVLGELWQGFRRQGLSQYHQFKVEGGKRYYIMLIFNDQHTQFMFVQRTPTHARHSITYPSKQLAMKMYGYKKITWTEYRELPGTDS